MRRMTALCLLTAVAALWIATAYANDGNLSTAGDDRVLHNLPGVLVKIEPINPEAKKDGLDEATIRADLERQMKVAGIQTFSEEACRNTPGNPRLHVRISAVKHRDGFYAYSTQLMLAEEVQLRRNPNTTTLAVTWNTGGIGMVSKQYLAAAIHKSLSDKGNDFIRDHVVANARRPASREKPARRP